MRRREFVALLGVATWPFAAHAQKEPARIGIFATTSQAGYQLPEKSFVDAMRELGYAEGRNVVYDRAYANDDETRLPALAAALVGRNPDVIHVISNPTALAVAAETRTIPIVMGASADPVAVGLVKSLARPGGNVTGIANIGFELGPKRLQLAKEALPKISRVGVLVNALYPQSLREQELIEQAALTLGVAVSPLSVKQAADLEPAFALGAKSRLEVVLTTHISPFLDLRKRVLEHAARQRIAVVGHRGELADDGALIAYGSVLSDQIRRSAHLVDRVLKGAKPAELPVEQPTKFEIVLNLRTARVLGLTLSQSVLGRADRVIE
jgi:putative ABC transport system substrate-binding protein